MYWFNETHLPSAAYMGPWTGSALAQIMACRLFGTKPLPEAMLANCQWDSWEQISMKFSFEFYHFHLRKCIWNCRLAKWRPFCPGTWVKCLLLWNKCFGSHSLHNNITACFMIADKSFVFIVFLSAVHLIEFRVQPDQGSLYQPAHVLTKKSWLMFYEKCWK